MKFDMSTATFINMYTYAKLYLEGRIRAAEISGEKCDDYKQSLDEMGESWREHLASFENKDSK